MSKTEYGKKNIADGTPPKNVQSFGDLFLVGLAIYQTFEKV